MNIVRTGLVASAFGMLFGYSTAVISGVLDQTTEVFALTTGQAETMVSILVFAALAGALAGGPIATLLGRRTALLIASLLALAGYAAMLGPALGLAISFPALLCLRIVIGFGVGLSSVVAPLYVAETTTAARRGALVTLFQLAVCGGILAAYVLNWALAGAPWTTVIAYGLVPAGLGLLATALVPESPRWLILRRPQRRSTAAAIARQLGIHAELDWTAAEGKGVQLPLRTALRQGSSGRVLALVSLLFILQNLSGIDAILYYAPRIFENLGFTGGSVALMATAGLGLVNLLVTVASLTLVDRLGRRPLLLGGSVVMTGGLLLCVAAGAWQSPILALVGLCAFLAAFALSLGPVPYVLLSELLPGALRETGSAIATGISWLFNALVAFTFLSLMQGIGTGGTFGFFAGACVLTAVVTALLVPETRGLPLESIEETVLQGRPLRRLGPRAAPTPTPALRAP